MLSQAKVDSLIDERGGSFRIDRSVYLDPDLFQAEIELLFEGGWIFLAHESQLRNPGDYLAARMGRQPIFLVRKMDGSIGGFINACAHRGATLVPLECGNAKVFRCRFHGWTYNHDGKCLVIKNEETGAYPDPEYKARVSLAPVPRIESYRGFVFGSLRAGVPSLKDWLAGTAAWIDCLVDQSPLGLEVVRGTATYTVHGNWKLQAENGVDGYHVSTVHRVFAATIANREAKTPVEGMQETESGRIMGHVASGSYDFGNGHMGVWTRRTKPSAHPLWREKDRLEREFPKERVEWMLNRTRNLYLFPNAFLMDNPSSQIRTLQPLSPDVCEVTVRCIAPVGEPPGARAARLRKFEDFYLTTGMATSDDLAALEATHDGGRGRAARWNEFARGSTAIRRGTEDGDGALIGIVPRAMTPNWDHEVIYHGFYRAWKQRISEVAGA